MPKLFAELSLWESFKLKSLRSHKDESGCFWGFIDNPHSFFSARQMSLGHGCAEQRAQSCQWCLVSQHLTCYHSRQSRDTLGKVCSGSVSPVTQEIQIPSIVPTVGIVGFQDKHTNALFLPNPCRTSHQRMLDWAGTVCSFERLFLPNIQH